MMTSSLLKKDSQSTTLPLTPSPSPPTSSQHLPDPMSSTKSYTEAERQAHVFLARQCADQLMKLHLANGAQKVTETVDSGLEKYHVEVERIEGDKKVKRRVAVIVPRAQRDHFRQHQLPSLTLVPPPHLGASPSKKPSLFPYTKNSGSPARTRTTPARRLSLPSLRSLSLLPTTSTCTAPTPFRSRKERSPLPSKTPHSSPSKYHPNPPSSLSTPQLPASIRLETSSKLLQRRKLALALKYERKTRIDPVPPPPVLPPSPPRTNSSTPSLEIEDVLSKAGTRMKRTRSSSEEENEEDSLRAKCARWARHVRSSTAEEQVATQSSGRFGRELSTGERMKREREVSLGERRGKKLSCLRIV
ncbi:hypothetical protein JCM5350_005738 [Sporobolomyces pararoseus]